MTPAADAAVSCLRVDERHGVARLTLARPERHNALVPELMMPLRDAVLGLAGRDVAAVVLAGEGRSFSTGGDVAAFLAEAEKGAAAVHAYAQTLVGALHDTILGLLALPVPVIARVQGAVTGGSAGLVLAADLVTMGEGAFLQPWYAEVGFGPDGGWTALLPERIGAGRAMGVQALNSRIGAGEALKLGLATAVVPDDALDGTVDGWLAQIAGKSRPSLAASRAGIWDEERLAQVRQRLDAERDRFLELIGRDETIAGMRRFLAQATRG